MGLSIKDARTEQLVRTLAERRKTGVTGAIKLAVSNELARDEIAHLAEIERKSAVIRDMQAWVAARGGMPSMAEIDGGLYDEAGLPK